MLRFDNIRRYKELLSRRQFLKRLWSLALGLMGITIFSKYLFKRLNGRALASSTKVFLYEAKYYEKLSGERIRCNICFRGCVVSNGGRGFCRNKENRKGTYYTLIYDRPCAIHVDPIEKEPALHMLPGSSIFCLATASCNNRCKFCHNWHISQRSVEETTNYYFTPQDIVRMAKESNSCAVSFTYAEPIAFYEYMFDIAKLAKQEGLRTLCHTNGLINRAPLLALLQTLDAITIDLKGFTNKFYHDVCSSRLEPVLESLKTIRQTQVHLEIVNLVIPTLNDNEDDIKRMCSWIKNHLGEQTPLHFSRFFPSYKLRNLPPTPIPTLEKAKEIADEVGLHYVTIGNVPGHKYNSTYCPRCKKRLVHRVHFRVYTNNVQEGRCRFCRHPIPGIWI